MSIIQSSSGEFSAMAGQRSELCGPEGTVVTFYANLTDEVELHFAKALSMAANPQGKSPAAIRSSSPVSPPQGRDQSEGQSSPDTVEPSDDFRPVRCPSAQPPTHELPLSFGGPLSPATPPALPPGRGRIVYPEFVNFLVHPEVDPYKDLPKLPGQTDSPPPIPLTHIRWRRETQLHGDWLPAEDSHPQLMSTHPLHPHHPPLHSQPHPPPAPHHPPTHSLHSQPHPPSVPYHPPSNPLHSQPHPPSVPATNPLQLWASAELASTHAHHTLPLSLHHPARETGVEGRAASAGGYGELGLTLTEEELQEILDLKQEDL